jgi:hypothetical protein
LAVEGALGELRNARELAFALEEVVCGTLEQGPSIIRAAGLGSKDWGLLWGPPPMRSRTGFSTLRREVHRD